MLIGGGWQRDELYSERPSAPAMAVTVGLRLVLLAFVVLATRAPPPQANGCRMTQEKRHGGGGGTLTALRRVRIRSSIACFQPIVNNARRRV